jgi:uncharacterized repeat protein (TIGR01451 family)
MPAAELLVFVSDGRDTVVPGTSTTYTINVFNLGPDDVIGASVTDPLPFGATGATWLAMANTGGGSVSGPTSGSGALATTVDLPVNSGVAFDFTVQVDPSATGTLFNIATISPPAGTIQLLLRDSSEDFDALTPEADLAVTMDDGKATVVAGTNDTYMITVTNNGPSTAVNALVTDGFPAALVGVSWTATTTGAGNSVAAPNGAGNINTLVTLLPGGTATFTAVGQISPSATGTLVNTASITPPAGTTDPNPANNIVTDTDTILTADHRRGGHQRHLHDHGYQQRAEHGQQLHPGETDMIMRNVNSGAFEVYNIANDQITGAASLGQVGLEWQLGGPAADPPAGSTGGSGSTSQLMQAMASFGGSSGAADGLNTAPLGTEASQQQFLTTPQHV